VNDPSEPQPEHQAPARWRPLAAIDRRVAGVLIEKGKTTPSAYPMTLNAVTTGCNQKSNRSPEMQLEPDDVEESLDRLRLAGAVGLVEGAGRVPKYRHYLYDWLGVEKVELAVMAELLLRGPQTEGQLRGRASRMDPIADLAALRAILESLETKGLVIPLTPPGRGHMVTHALYEPAELERVRRQYSAPAATTLPQPAQPPPRPAAADLPPAGVAPEALLALHHQLEELRLQVAQLRSDLEDLATAHQQTTDELERLKAELGA